MASSKRAEKKAPPPSGVGDKNKHHSGVGSIQAHKILAAIFAWRLINALFVRTYFQPDEYFQALEPAWQLVYGKDSGAWLTWVYTAHLSYHLSYNLNWSLITFVGMGPWTALITASRNFRAGLPGC